MLIKQHKLEESAFFNEVEDQNQFGYSQSRFFHLFNTMYINVLHYMYKSLSVTSERFLNANNF